MMMMMMMMMMMTTVITLMMTTLALMICLLGAFENLFWLVLFWIVEFLAQLLPVNRTYCNDNRGPKIDTQFTNFCTFFATFIDPLASATVMCRTPQQRKTSSDPNFFLEEKRRASFLFFSKTRTELLLARKQTPIRVQLEKLCKNHLGSKNFKIFQKFSNFWEFFFWVRSSNFSILSSDRARIGRVLDHSEEKTQKFDTTSSNEPPQVGYFL